MLTAALGAVATANGIGVALLGARGLVALMPAEVPRLAGAHVDRTVLGFVLAVASLTTLVVGYTSATTGIPRAGASLNLSIARATTRLRGARLVTAELAIGLILSVLAMLMVRSFVKLASVNLGFRSEHVAVARVSLPSQRYATAVEQRQFFDALVGRVRAIPGVTAASVATTSPFACCAPATNSRDAARADDARAPSPTTDVRFVDASYFSTLRIPLLGGSVFAPAEPSTGAPRIVISRSLASALWGGANPIGRHVSLTLFGTTTAEVIGIVGDVHHGGLRTPPRAAAYLSTNRFPSSERDLIVRGDGDPTALIAPLRETLATLDPAVPLYRAATLDHTVGQTLAQDRFVTALLSAFAIIALLLTSVGVHGVLSGDLARRRKELGIRVALGADSASVYALIIRRILKPSLVGLAFGISGALLLARAMSALLFGIGTWDPASFALVVVVVITIAIVTTWHAARRASRVSPLEAIKSDAG
jgi:predicted permease